MGIFGKPNIDRLLAAGKVKKLIKILTSDKWPELQIEAAEALGELGDKSAVEPLIEALAAGDGKLKMAAAEALGRIGAPAAGAELIATLQKPGYEALRITCLKALGNIRSKNAVEHIIGLLEAESRLTRISAVEALGNIGDKRALEPLARIVWTDSAELKIAIITALREIGGDLAVKVLMEIHKAGSPKVREAAASALSRLGWRPTRETADSWKAGEEDELTFEIPFKLMELIRGKGDLPAIPDIVLKLNRKLIDPECTLKNVGDLVKTDPALAARVIQVSNSAFYSRSPIKIADIQTAVTRLGIFQMRNIVFAFSILKQFDAARLVNKRKFWTHSFVAAQLAQSMVKVMNRPEAEQELAYLAGLMHDIGIPVMVHLMPGSYEEFLRRIVGDHSDDPEFSLHKEENKSFRTDHATVGAAYIHHWWPVDETVVKAVLHHHRRLDRRDNPFISMVVIMANEYCHSIGIDNGVSFQLHPKPIEVETFKLLEMTDDQIRRFIYTVKENVEAAEAVLSLS